MYILEDVGLTILMMCFIYDTLVGEKLKFVSYHMCFGCKNEYVVRRRLTHNFNVLRYEVLRVGKFE